MLWEAIERQIPDVRQRAKVTLVGTPLTHERFLRRERGSYGPFLSAKDGMLPMQGTGCDGFFCCGDSTFPGIGMCCCYLLRCRAEAATLSWREANLEPIETTFLCLFF